MVIFEHGGIKDGGRNQSVYHQHAHICTSGGYDTIRYMADMLEAEGVFFDPVDTVDRSPIINLQREFKGQPYFYVQQGARGIMAHNRDDQIPSQLMQRNMSRLLSGRVLDWKRIGAEEELAVLAVLRIANLLERCKQ